MPLPNSYLISISFLGFRFHGWAKQKNLLTVHGCIDKTLAYCLPNKKFKTIGCSRTDSKVSALDYKFQLWLDQPLQHPETFLKLFNRHLPSDIKAHELETIAADFDLIGCKKMKTYHYRIWPTELMPPFYAPFYLPVSPTINIERMREGAKLFEGQHNFINYASDNKVDKNYFRKISSCKLTSPSTNNLSELPITQPDESLFFIIEAEGFLRHQIRLMMGQLLNLGIGIISLNDIRKSLICKLDQPFKEIAPASPLTLQKVIFSR